MSVQHFTPPQSRAIIAAARAAQASIDEDSFMQPLSRFILPLQKAASVSANAPPCQSNMPFILSLRGKPIHKVLEMSRVGQHLPKLILSDIEALRKDPLMDPEVRQIFTPVDCDVATRKLYSTPVLDLTINQLRQMQQQIHQMVTTKFAGWNNHPSLAPQQPMKVEQLLDILRHSKAPGQGFVLEAMMNLPSFETIPHSAVMMALRYAIRSQQVEALNRFIASTKYKEISFKEFSLMLVEAIRGEDPRIIHLLNSQKWFIIALTESLSMVLRKAVKEKKVTVDQLFEYFYLPQIFPEQFAEAFQETVEGDIRSFVAQVIGQCPICSQYVSQHLGQALLQAAQRRDIKVVKAILETRAYAYHLIPSLEMALEHAVMQGDVDLCFELIHNPVFPEIRPEKFDGLIFRAEAFDRRNILNILIRNTPRCKHAAKFSWMQKTTPLEISV